MNRTITRSLLAAATAGSLLAGPALALDAQAAPLPAATTVVARPGSTGATVKKIQTHLHTLGYLPTSAIIGTYGPKTTAAVKSFQKANKLAVTGITDSRTYALLSSKATAALKAYRARVAKQQAALNAVVAKPGDNNNTVKQIQGRLAGLGYLSNSSVIGKYGPKTTAAVKAFQRAHKLSVTGVVNGRTNNAIIAAYKNRKSTPATTVKLNSRCLTGRVVCVNKSTLRMYWVINGKVQDDWSVRVGRPSLPTREGTFHIYLKSTNWWSTLYNVRMPYSQFFSGGEAIHYSVDFATNGYYGGGSHGCVNMRDLAGAKWLYSQTRIGDKVVVYR